MKGKGEQEGMYVHNTQDTICHYLKLKKQRKQVNNKGMAKSTGDKIGMVGA